MLKDCLTFVITFLVFNRGLSIFITHGIVEICGIFRYESGDLECHAFGSILCYMLYCDSITISLYQWPRTMLWNGLRQLSIRAAVFFKIVFRCLCVLFLWIDVDMAVPIQNNCNANTINKAMSPKS